MFLLYSPLNQGLKQLENIQVSFISLVFLLYSPLNQGLKHTLVTLQDIPDERVFTLQSIKSRIET